MECIHLTFYKYKKLYFNNSYYKTEYNLNLTKHILERFKHYILLKIDKI